MKRVILIVAVLGLCVGCNTVRKGVGLVDSGASAVFAVKDDVIGAVKTIIDAAESIKTNAVPKAVAAVP
jgi:hypothetical protein